jgi:hypothetical protein
LARAAGISFYPACIIGMCNKYWSYKEVNKYSAQKS